MSFNHSSIHRLIKWKSIMSDPYYFTKSQLNFLDLFKIAADYNCLYLLDYHCMDLFDHDGVGTLSEEQQEQLAYAACPDIFSEAIQAGYRPLSEKLFGETHASVC